MNTVAIIDYQMCNLDSVARAVEECGGHPLITADKREVESATHIILPGVGAFGEAMANIRSLGLDETMSEQVFGQNIPFLGICLGMQLLGTNGYEEGENAGLGWIESEVIRLQPSEPHTRIPHMGWNQVDILQDCPLFDNINSGRDFYFVHSYHLVPAKNNVIVGSTPYAGGFVSCVNSGNVYGVQFHPEKSQKVGFQILRNFLAL